MRVSCLLLLAAMASAGAAYSMDPIQYTVRFPAPQTHYAEVTAVFPAAQQSEVEVFMAVWTPGSYLVREFARNVENVQAFDASGKALSITKSRKNRWRIVTGGSPSVTVKYRVYGREMSVRTNWVDERFALLNGAATFLSLADHQPRAHDVTIELPQGWSRTMTGMPFAADGKPNHYTAPDFDTLVDCPIVAGSPAVYEFEVDGKKHYLVNQGEDGVFDGKRAAADVEKIVREHRRMWGFLPYDRYVFLNLITESGGGLEHKNSFVIMSSRWATRTHKSYVDWLSLVSHEYFHAWNVKRLRPVELGPFDYEAENYTSNLWVAEGFTEYYAMLALKRAGLCSEKEYLGIGPATETSRASLSRIIEDLQTTPGRLTQAVADSSFDAWIKLYRPDENSGNTTISYYTKGAVVGWLLDARVREATKDKKSLDDVMRLAYQHFAGSTGYTRQQFFQTASEVAGEDLRPFFADAVESTKELDYTQALNWFGLRFKADSEKKDAATLGAVTKVDAGRLIVSNVPRGTAADQAGLSVDDELLAVDGFRIKADQWKQRAEQYRPGDKSKLLVARRDRIIEVPIEWSKEPARVWQLEARPDANHAQKKHLQSWLGERAGD